MGPDEAVATELDAVAERAGRAGANETALRAFEAAARASEDASRGAGRLLRAVELAHDLGQRERTLQILGELDTGALETAERPRLDWIREVVTGGAWTGGDRIGAFVAIARRMADAGDRRRAMGILVSIALRAWWSNLDPTSRAAVAEAADHVQTDVNDPTYLSVSALATPLERGRDLLSAYGPVAVPRSLPGLPAAVAARPRRYCHRGPGTSRSPVVRRNHRVSPPGPHGCTHAVVAGPRVGGDAPGSTQPEPMSPPRKGSGSPGRRVSRSGGPPVSWPAPRLWTSRQRGGGRGSG